MLNTINLKWSFAFILFLILAAKPILSVFGENFEPGVESLLFLSLGGFFEGTFRAVRIAFAMSGHNKSDVYNYALAITVNVAIALWAIPKYGLIGASMAYSVTYVVLSLTRITYFYKLTQMAPFQWRNLTFIPFSILATFAIYFVVTKFPLSTNVQLVIYIAFFAVLLLSLFATEVRSLLSQYLRFLPLKK